MTKSLRRYAVLFLSLALAWPAAAAQRTTPGIPRLPGAAAAPVQVGVNGRIDLLAAPVLRAYAEPTNANFIYDHRRRVLRGIADDWGMEYSLQPVGAKLARKIVRVAAESLIVFSDIDDTLTKYNTLLSAEMAEAVAGIHAAGKQFVAITDRPDVVRAGSSQMSAFDSLAAIPAKKRVGLMVATSGGGKIYRYDEKGEPRMIYEEPGIEESQRVAINAAAAAVEARLAEFGTGLQTTDTQNPKTTIDPHSHSPYGYSMILKVGTPESTVKKLAQLLQDELKSRGLDYKVHGRMAKDPTMSPYLTFSKLDKSLPVRHIAEMLKVDARDAVALGDSMYKPSDVPIIDSPSMRRARARGEYYSGGEMPLTGNAVDANMERGLPGMLMLSVGGTASPLMRHGYVLPGKGPAVTLGVLRAIGAWPAE